MEEIHRDLSSDFLENEKFDFDLAFSPNINPGQINEPQEAGDEEEVFFGPVGFTEKCVATRAKVLQEENNIKPLSPLTGEQVVEVFKEATKVALRFEKLSSTAQSPVSTSNTCSFSSSILKLSSSSESPSWLTGKLSSGSSEGTSLGQFELDFDKENIQPLLRKEENFHGNENEQIPLVNRNEHIALADKNGQISPANSKKEKIMSNIDGKSQENCDFDNENSLDKNAQQTSAIFGETINSDDTKGSKIDQNEDIETLSIDENLNTAQNEQHDPAMLRKLTVSGKESEQVNGEKMLKREVVEQKTASGTKEIKSNKIPVVKARGSNLPRPGLRNSRLPKSKNTEKSQSAFSSPIRTTGSSKKRDALKNEMAEKPTRSVEKSGTSKSANTKLQKSVPDKLPQDATKVHSKSAKTLAKRKIFNSSESLDKLGTKDCKSKTKFPVSEQSKISGVRPRRRRSSSLSSLDSSQSSVSSHTSQDDNGTSKLIRPSTKIPTTKVSLASSFGLTRRSKLQDTTADKKPQPLKALPRPGFTSSAKNSKTDTKPAKAMLPPSTEPNLKDDKIPMPATPRSSSSLVVARRRSSFKSSLSSTSSREGSPPKYFTPSKPAGKITEPRGRSSTCKRRSNPTPSRSAPSSASRRMLRSSGDDSILLSLSPASKPKKNQESARKTNRKLIPDNDPHSIDRERLSLQTVDDLLDCDNTDAILGYIVPIQPKPIAQADLIDLSGL